MLKQNLWHIKNIPEILDIFHSREHGLTDKEAEDRIQKYGINKLPEGRPDNILIIFLRQFQSPLIFILIAAAVVVLIMGEVVDAYVIFAVLFFNAIVGAFQEGRARNTLLALKKFSETSATVLRDGRDILIPDSKIVPGDIVVLQEGEKVPADARIIFSNILKIDEASLTGESEPVDKIEATITNVDLQIADRTNMVFKGTNVLSGNGSAVAVATGLNTEIGKIAQKIATIDTEIPLKANIRYLSRLIILVVAVVSVFLVFLGVFFGSSLKEMFSVAVALAVSVIPEGLPIVITLVLATGVRRMSKHNVLVKRLQAVESLGQTKVIAVDKTGTLTRNEMIVQQIFVADKNFKITGEGYDPKGEIIHNENVVDPLNHPELLFCGKVAAFCANAKLSFLEETKTWRISGDPTEAAMLVFSEKIGFHHDLLDTETPKIFELPFDYKKKYHLTVREDEGKNFLAVAGAPEEIMELCTSVWHPHGNEILNKKKKKELESVFTEFARQGFRVLACAACEEAPKNIDPDNMPALSFVGFLGMHDALRPEVKDAMQKVKSAGMRVVMITGDHRLTAQVIAKEAGIWCEGDIILVGEEIDSLSDKELENKISQVSVFSRVTPNHKLRIIEAFRKRGEIVAMTGDGVNDAPSLVAADLGVAMGKIGTEVAKEASDIILLDDNFASIVSAAEEGRGIYKTIKKVILYLFSTSLGEILVIVSAIAIGFPSPLVASQIIWLNFITDGFLTIALVFDPKEKGLMQGKFDKPKKWILDKLMTQRMFIMALPMVIGTLLLFREYFGGDMVKVWSISLTTLAVFQWFNAWNCRSESKSIFQMNPFSNMFLVGATGLVILLQLAALHLPFLQKVLRTMPLTLSEWLIIILVSGSIVVVEEIRKFFYRRKLRLQQL